MNGDAAMMRRDKRDKRDKREKPEGDTTLGPTVLLVRTDVDGRITSEWMPVAMALSAMQDWNEDTEDWMSVRIVADDVDLRQWGG